MRTKGARTDDSIQRGRNSNVAIRKFIGWNAMRAGKRKLSCASSVYWYFDSVFFRGWKPIARYVRAPGRVSGGVFCLWDEWFYGKREVIGDAALFHVDNICAGLTPDMVMPADEFLENVRRQYLSRARWLVERFAGFQMGNAQGWHDSWKQRVVEVAESYGRVNRMFEMGWDDFPTEELTRAIDDEVARKIAHYNRPSAERKRERSRAKWQALRALGLNEEVPMKKR